MKAVSSGWARRFIGSGGIDSFRTALDRENYWTIEVFDLMVQRCDDLIFLNPQEGLEGSKILLDLIVRIRGIDDERRALAHAVLGSALRGMSLYSDARSSYEKALSLAQSDVVRGRIFQRCSVLEWAEGDFDLSFSFINDSIDLLSGHDLGTSLTLRGSLHAVTGNLSKSVQDHGNALTLLRSGSRSYFCAIRNLGDSLCSLHDLDKIGEVMALLKKCRSMAMEMSRTRRRCPLAFIDWVEGRVNGKLGSHRRAVALLKKARKCLLSLGGDYLRDGLLVSVDLAMALDGMGDLNQANDELQNSLSIAITHRLTESANVIRAYSKNSGRFVDLRKKLQEV